MATTSVAITLSAATRAEKNSGSIETGEGGGSSMACSHDSQALPSSPAPLPAGEECAAARVRGVAPLLIIELHVLRRAALPLQLHFPARSFASGGPHCESARA